VAREQHVRQVDDREPVRQGRGGEACGRQADGGQSRPGRRREVRRPSSKLRPLDADGAAADQRGEPVRCGADRPEMAPRDLVDRQRPEPRQVAQDRQVAVRELDRSLRRHPSPSGERACDRRPTSIFGCYIQPTPWRPWGREQSRVFPLDPGDSGERSGARGVGKISYASFLVFWLAGIMGFWHSSMLVRWRSSILAFQQVLLGPDLLRAAQDRPAPFGLELGKRDRWSSFASHRLFPERPAGRPSCRPGPDASGRAAGRGSVPR
jgi:hypothetical protein